jgi:hypothetical protein
VKSIFNIKNRKKEKLSLVPVGNTNQSIFSTGTKDQSLVPGLKINL